MIEAYRVIKEYSWNELAATFPAIFERELGDAEREQALSFQVGIMIFLASKAGLISKPKARSYIFRVWRKSGLHHAMMDGFVYGRDNFRGGIGVI